jgi:hypothetical protein
MVKLKLNLDLETKHNNEGKLIRRRRKKARKKTYKDKIYLQAHNPGKSNQQYNLPYNIPNNLVIERPNIDQSNKLTQLSEQVNNQSKMLENNKVETSNLIKSIENIKNPVVYNQLYYSTLENVNRGNLILDKDTQGKIIVKEPDEDEFITQNEMKNNQDILKDLLIESPDKLKEVNKEIKKK